jgi:hypothetical protein
MAPETLQTAHARRKLMLVPSETVDGKTRFMPPEEFNKAVLSMIPSKD